MAKDFTGIYGIAQIALYDEDGNLKWEESKKNLITTMGDFFYCESGVNAIAGYTRTKAVHTGMKLGTGTTAVAKASTGSALTTYKTASNVLYTTNAASVAAVGGNTGYKVTYSCTWGAGIATDTALTEAVIVNDAAANATSTEANTYARVVFTAINKGASDTLVLNWDHVFYDAP